VGALRFQQFYDDLGPTFPASKFPLVSFFSFSRGDHLITVVFSLPLCDSRSFEVWNEAVPASPTNHDPRRATCRYRRADHHELPPVTGSRYAGIKPIQYPRVAGWLTGYSGGCSEAAAGDAVDQISRERPKREELDNRGRVLTYYIKHGWFDSILTRIFVTERVQTLLQLRQHGTNPTSAEPIYSQNVWQYRYIHCQSE
jgi:hypothetical protein